MTDHFYFVLLLPRATLILLLLLLLSFLISIIIILIPIGPDQKYHAYLMPYGAQQHTYVGNYAETDWTRPGWLADWLTD